MSFDYLIAGRPNIPPERLAAPTLGAWRRANGVDGWSVEARTCFAVAVVEEARKRVLLERLDSIQQFVAAGATVDQATERLLDLTDDLIIVDRAVAA